jgi:hypothetical protein
MPNLLEIAQARQIPFTEGIIEAVQTAVPALMAMSARTSPGTTFKSLARTSLPTASGFKDYGEGFTNGTAGFSLREFEAKLCGALVQVEDITAARWDAEKGVDSPSYFQLQVNARMESELRNIERAMFLGTVQDAKAFPGLKQLTPFVSSNVIELTEEPADTDYARTTIDAGGSTSSTASSVYAVVEGPLDCQLVVCNDGAGGEFFKMSEPVKQHIAPDTNSPTELLLYTLTQIHAHFGISVSGMNQTPNSVVPTQYSLRRIANLTAQNGCTLNDANLELLCDSFPDSKRPTKLFMSYRSGRQWADSRSASTVTLNLGGPGDAKNNTASIRAARPMFFEEIPVVYTSAIGNTDAIEVE